MFERRPVNTLGTDELSWADYQFVSFMVHFSLLLVLSILHLFADKPPTVSHYPETKGDKPCPELKASFVRRVFFLWFDKDMWKGYRKPLTNDDMYDIQPDEMSLNINPIFIKNWEENVAKNQAAGDAKAAKDPKHDSSQKRTHVSKTYISILECCLKSVFFSECYRETLYRC